MNGNDKIVDIDFRLRRGNFELKARFETEGGLTTLFGRSGAGKSTIIDCLAGLARPDSGHIRIAGETLFDKSAGIDLAPEKRRVGYVFQDARLFPHMRVRSNLEYGMKRIAPAERRHSIDDVVAMLGISKLLERYPADLSGGEVQRVAIGRALLASPKILLMDEPLAALDFDRKAEIMPFIEKLRDHAGVPIMYVSHAVEEVVRLADTMVVLADGDTIAFGDVEDIMSRLDLRPHTGRFEAGAVIHVWVSGHDDEYMLTELGFGAGAVWVPRLELERGTPLRLRLRARDVSLSLERPRGSMTLNIFEATIVDIENVAEGVSPHVDVLVNAGAPIIARVTRRSVAEYGLEAGMKVFVSVKTSSIDRHSLGLGRRR
ncbi:molybdenum ABC transporter ATP-binding protein [Thalassospiraceae bacterium LMO-JJ14]|nr:molybdenum ABC transporter ATP-binding protein [Thalassospiraceae bacterium LMO-JJ14]